MRHGTRTATRRWYLQDRVAVLDPDALTFRSQDALPTTGPTEQRTFAVFLSLLGGIVEVGDPLVSLSPFALDTVRRMLPPYGRSARRLDVFARDYNERCTLRVEPSSREPEAPRAWTLGVITHWGRNRDASVTPFAPMADTARSYVFSRAELGLGAGSYVAWDLLQNEELPLSAEGLRLQVAAHNTSVVLEHERSAPVFVLGTDRHFNGGADDLLSSRWDEASKECTVRLRVYAPNAGGRGRRLLEAGPSRGRRA